MFSHSGRCGTLSADRAAWRPIPAIFESKNKSYAWSVRCRTNRDWGVFRFGTLISAAPAWRRHRRRLTTYARDRDGAGVVHRADSSLHSMGRCAAAVSNPVLPGPLGKSVFRLRVRLVSWEMSAFSFSMYVRARALNLDRQHADP